MRRAILIISGLAAVGIAVWAWQAASGDPARGQSLRWQDPEVIAVGEEIYMRERAACHGADLEGQPDWQARMENGRLPAPPHDETGHTWHHPDDVLIAITTHGTAALVGGDYQSDMLGFGDRLSDAEIVAVLSYIKSTWSEEVIAIHNEINARATAEQDG